MIFSIKTAKNNIIEEACRVSMNELNDFFGINWVENTPNIFIVPNREEFDNLLGRKTEDWLIGYGVNKSIYVLNKINFEKNSNHQYSNSKYQQLIKHELCHLFQEAISRYLCPIWLSEGLAVYLSEEIKDNNGEFSSFLHSYFTVEKSSYDEGGYFVKFLIQKFGKEKFIQFLYRINKLNYITSDDKNLIKNQENFRKNFNSLFKKVFKFDLTYKKINGQYIDFYKVT
ncbi:MAG: hypothetical protein WCC74_03165 [Minisyncoccia bacterium]